MSNSRKQEAMHFPRKIGTTVLNFEEWATEVKQQMLASLQKKRPNGEESI